MSITKELNKTNIVFILADDLGQWAMGCYGNNEILTPNIDRLASTGLIFDNSFCTSPVCSPARASILTGTIPSAHGIHDWIRDGNMPPESIEFLNGKTTYTDILSKNGWLCALVGKWHLGDSTHPQQGFSHWFCHPKGSGPYNDQPMIRDGKLTPTKGYITDIISEEACSFITNHTDEPFCLQVHYTAPHSPWTGHPTDILDLYDLCPFSTCPQEPQHPWAGPLTRSSLGNRDYLKGYFAAVTAMDRGIGKIVKTLEESGNLENTLIIFTSDNGFSCGHHGFWGKGNGTFPLNMYENSIRVPLIVSQIGKIPYGWRTNAMISQYDFFPTILAYLGLEKDIPNGLPGISFVSVLTGDTDEARDEVVVYDEYGPVRMIRTQEWKYIHRYPYGIHELYHLIPDPDERINLIDDLNCVGILSELRNRMSRWFLEFVNPLYDGAHLPITGSGQKKLLGDNLCAEQAFAKDRIIMDPKGFPVIDHTLELG